MQPAAPVTTSPSPRRTAVTGVQREFGLYKPMDLSQVKLEQFRPEILAITRRIATLDGKLYALPTCGLGRAGGQQQVHHGVPTMATCAARICRVRRPCACGARR